MKQRRHNRRGVSLVETVVAMTVVVIISIAALTAISASMNVNARDEATFQARVDARNALERFRGGETLTAANLSQFKPVTTSGDGALTVDYGWCTLTVTQTPAFQARAVGNTGNVLFEVNYGK